MAGVTTGLLMAALGLVIEGKVTCPSPSAVATAVRPLLREEISGTDNRLVLRELHGALVLELFDDWGELLAKRDLPLDVNCGAQAHRVAVIAAAWQAELSEEPLPPAPELKPRESAVRAARLWPEPAPPPSRPNPLFLGSGLRLNFAPNAGLATSVELEAGASWGLLGFGGGVWIEATRNVRGDTTSASFFRAAAELGPTLRVFGEPEIQVRLQAVASALFLNGALFDPGVAAGIRVIPGHPPVRLFFDASLVAWPRFFSYDPQIPLSWFEAFVGAGLFLGGT